jgi:hypothetical protein
MAKLFHKSLLMANRWERRRDVARSGRLAQTITEFAYEQVDFSLGSRPRIAVSLLEKLDQVLALPVDPLEIVRR